MIKLEGIQKVFNNNKIALKNLSLNFQNTGLVFVCGKSGSGKTTLLNIIGLLDSQTQGRYYFEETAVDKLSAKKRDEFRNHFVGVVFQDINLIEELTIKENVILPLQLLGRDLKSYDINTKLNSINLNENPQDFPKNLSGGERQRVAILRAIEKDSKVIIADEPTGSLDPENARVVMELLQKASKERLVIVVTHQIELAEQYGDRIITLENGSVIDDNSINIVPAQEKKELIAKRTSLPFSVMLKFAFKWLSKRKLSLIFSLITLLISLSAFALTLEFVQYNEIAGAKNGIVSENISYMRLSKYSTEDPQKTGFTLADEAQLATLFDENDVIKGLYNRSLSFIPAINFPYNNETIENYTSITGDQITNFGFSLVGYLPSEDIDSKEVMLTNYAAYQLSLLNAMNYDDPSAMQSILGKKIKIALEIGNIDIPEDEYSISGIINTNYKFPDSNLLENSTYRFIEANRLKYEMHSTVFFSQPTLQFLNDFFVSSFQMSTNSSAAHYYVNVQGENYDKALDFASKFKEGEVSLNSRLDYSLSMLNDMQNMLWQVAVVIGAIFLIISFLTFVSFVHNMLLNRQFSIQILRSLGSSFGSVNKIFMIQNFMFSSVVTILAGIVTFIGGNILNNIAKESFFVSIPLISFSLLVMLLIFAIVFFLFTVTATIQLIQTYRRKRVITKE